MKPLFSTEDFNNASSRDFLPLQCERCNQIFYSHKKEIQKVYKNSLKNKLKYCSKKCSLNYENTKQKVICKQCGKEFFKYKIKVKTSSNHFCSSSCSASYNNTHKNHGNRRSKLEIWIESQLTTLYPNLKIDYNKTSAINSELDVFIPSLKLAFELNGIFHYEPIYGKEKLSKIQNNDNKKFQACLEKHIELVIIDSSQETYFKPERVKKYLNVIVNTINKKL
jgi:hypothetical protein